MKINSTIESGQQKWEPVNEAFYKWIETRSELLKPGLNPQPTIKVLIFLALLEANKPCTYLELREIFNAKGVINGSIPNNTLRTSILNLGKTLDKAKHSLELKSERGKFQLVSRSSQNRLARQQDSTILILEPSPIKAEDIALELVEKARLPFHALYFSEWSARWWERFSHDESQIRVEYEIQAWEKLGIKERVLANSSELISVIGLAPGEGLAEIELLKKILLENPQKKIHYLAVDLSKRLLRQHINLLKETLATEIDNGRILCVGVLADIFSNFQDVLKLVRIELLDRSLINNENDFLPSSSSLLITYLGNCLGNCYQDQETEIFSIIHSTFRNRPLEFLVGVSLKRSTPDKYSRNWDDFLLQTPKHLLEASKLLESSRASDNLCLPEFNLPKTGDNERCPSVVPESYIVRHRIEGQIYRFYYKLEYDLNLAPSLNKELKSLPKGTLILLYNIVKYNIESLVNGIETCGLFKIKYNPNYHQIIDTPNGMREYAVFSAFLEK